MNIPGLVIRPVRYRPLTHFVLAIWMVGLTPVLAHIWWRNLETGVIDVRRGPSLVRAEAPELYWLGMGAMALFIILVAALAMLGVRAVWLNLKHGKAAR